MDRIGVRELRQHESRYLEIVKRSETIEVTERGKLVALLVPPTPSVVARDLLIARGQLLPAARRFQLPDTTAAVEGSSEAALDELQAERL